MRLPDILNKHRHGYARIKNTNNVVNPTVYSFSRGVLIDIRRDNTIETEKYSAERVLRDMSSTDWCLCDKHGKIDYDVHS